MNTPKRIIRIGSDEYPCFITIEAGYRYEESHDDEVYVDIEGYKPIHHVSLVDGEKKYEIVGHKRNIDELYTLPLADFRTWVNGLAILADEIEQSFDESDRKSKERRAKRKNEGKDPDLYSIEELIDGDV